MSLEAMPSMRLVHGDGKPNRDATDTVGETSPNVGAPVAVRCSRLEATLPRMTHRIRVQFALIGRGRIPS